LSRLSLDSRPTIVFDSYRTLKGINKLTNKLPHESTPTGYWLGILASGVIVGTALYSLLSTL
jgi:hypothetical protein